MDLFEVTVGAGSLRSTSDRVVAFPHRWTPGGVTVDGPFTGGHLLSLTVAGCVLNDTFREAERLGIALEGVQVVAVGAFDADWHSTGITYSIELDTMAPASDRAALIERVELVAEMPKALGQSTSVSLRR